MIKKSTVSYNREKITSNSFSNFLLLYKVSDYRQFYSKNLFNTRLIDTERGLKRYLPQDVVAIDLNTYILFNKLYLKTIVIGHNKNFSKYKYLFSAIVVEQIKHKILLKKMSRKHKSNPFSAVLAVNCDYYIKKKLSNNMLFNKQRNTLGFISRVSIRISDNFGKKLFLSLPTFYTLSIVMGGKK
jgi:hypothetical protein